MSNAVPLVPLLRALLAQHLAPEVAEEKGREELVAQRTDALWEEFRREHGRPPSDEENRDIQSAACDEVWIEQIGELDNASRDDRLWSGFPWNVAQSELFTAMRALPVGPPDSRTEDCELPGDPSRAESALREYLARVRLNEVAEPTPLSVELARLDADGFGTHLADVLQEKFPDTMSVILKAVQAAAGSGGRPEVTAPPGPPVSYLLNWTEILDALNLPNTEEKRGQVRVLNDKYDGPIVFSGQGGQPKVVKDKLLAWWNGLEGQFRARSQIQADAQASVQNNYDYSREGTVVPDIAGHVKKSRRKRECR